MVKNFRFHLKSGFKIILALNYYILFDVFNKYMYLINFWELDD